MKIIIRHAHARLTGVSTFVHTTAETLVKLGYDVTVQLDDADGPLTQELAKICPVTDKEMDGDIVIFGYATAAKAYTGDGESVFIVHGLHEQEYIPPENMKRIMCLSLRSYKYWRKRMPSIEVRMMNQPIDIWRFTPVKVNLRLTKVLILDSRNNAFYMNKFLSACSNNHAFMQVLGESMFGNNSTWAVERFIKEADLVVGYGRSLYEAMACGKPVLSYGINGGDGYLTPKSFERNFESNCSGWGDKTMERAPDLDVKTIEAELMKYNALDGRVNRALAERFFDPVENVNKILYGII